MKQYDTTFIINGTLDPDQREKLIAKYESILQKFGGTIDRVVRWGLRDMSYEINKIKRGYYVIFYYSAESQVIRQFESEMKLNENILRFMTILFDGNHPDYIKDETKKDTEPVAPIAEPVAPLTESVAPLTEPVAPIEEQIETPVVEDIIVTDTPVDDSTEESVETPEIAEPEHKPEVSENDADTESLDTTTDTTTESENSEEIEADDDKKDDAPEE